jgi:acyl dehydratase
MELTVGQTAELSRKFDKFAVLAFAELTGDHNPVHFDENYAKSTVFKRPIVHGPFVLTLITTLFANQLPGAGSVYLSHDLRFLKPVYYDDVITAKVKIVEITVKNHILLDTTCYNQHDEVVIVGTARIKKF